MKLKVVLALVAMAALVATANAAILFESDMQPPTVAAGATGSATSAGWIYEAGPGSTYLKIYHPNVTADMNTTPPLGVNVLRNSLVNQEGGVGAQLVNFMNYTVTLQPSEVYSVTATIGVPKSTNASITETVGNYLLLGVEDLTAYTSLTLDQIAPALTSIANTNQGTYYTFTAPSYTTEQLEGLGASVGDTLALLVGMGSGYVTDVILNGSPEVAPVPEPCSMLVWSLLGGCGIAVAAWRRKRAG